MPALTSSLSFCGYPATEPDVAWMIRTSRSDSALHCPSPISLFQVINCTVEPVKIMAPARLHSAAGYYPISDTIPCTVLPSFTACPRS